MRWYRVRAPSGTELRVHAREGALRDDDALDGETVLFGRAWRALLEPGAIERRDRDRWIAIDRDAVLGLPLRDAHALRDLLLRVGAIAPEPDDDATCRNCDSPLPFDPRELDPGELAEREPAPLGGIEPLALPSPLRLPRGITATHADVRPVSLGEAMPLFRALAASPRYRITPRVLAAMGVRALGEVDQPVLVARALARSSDEIWSAIERRYLELNSPPPIVAPLACPSCGAMHEIEVPHPRELDPDAAPPRSSASEPFPSAERFEELVERLAPAIYERRGVANVALRVEPGVPATDIAGEPLLGSYEPRQDVDAAGYTQLEFLVTLYYQTFRRIWDEEGPYDLEAEIRETIDHELEHHLHHLSGHDPLDAEERAEARAEIRKLYGDRRLAKLAARGALADLAAFARATWPFLLLIAVGLALAAWAGLWR